MDYEPNQLHHQGCGHRYCKDCWDGYLQSKLNGSSTLLITCPDPDCSHFIRKDFILSHVTGEALENYKTLVSNQEIPVKHSLLKLFSQAEQNQRENALICADTDYYHYECLCEVDTGWGCSYRSLQMLLSCIKHSQVATVEEIPSIFDIQTKLVTCGNPPSFKESEINTPTWIGPYEIREFLESEYPTIEFHIADLFDYQEFIQHIKEHFQKNSPLPVICANGKKTYTIVGFSNSGENEEILVMDPHFNENASIDNFKTFYEALEKYEPSSTEEEQRKIEMLQRAVRWENSEEFFSEEPLWSLLLSL